MLDLYLPRGEKKRNLNNKCNMYWPNDLKKVKYFENWLDPDLMTIGFFCSCIKYLFLFMKLIFLLKKVNSLV